MINGLRKRMARVLLSCMLAFGLLLVPLPGSNADALDLGASYDVLLRDHPDCIQRLKDGGASDTGIQAFLTDLEANVSSRGTLNQANFNSYMYQSLKEVVTWRKHRVIFSALVESYGDEINYTLENNQLHPGLVPIRNAVMEAVFSDDSNIDDEDEFDEEETEQAEEPTDPKTENPETNPVIPPEDEQEDQQEEEEENQIDENDEIDEEEIVEEEPEEQTTPPLLITDALTREIQLQLSNSSNNISLDGSTNGQVITIKGDMLARIWNASRSLNINFNGVVMELDPGSISLAQQNSLSLSVTRLSSTRQNAIMGQTPSNYTLLGSIYELAGTTEFSLGELSFDQPVTVILPYTQKQLGSLNEETLDIYYYNDNSKAWQKMNGNLNKTGKTISFTTSHFSKYAVMSYNPAPASPTSSTGRFTDLKGHWAQPDIDVMVSQGLVNGVSDDQFSPDINVTRAEFAAMLLRAMGIKEGLHLVGKFYDIPADRWYFGIVNTAAELGLITGYSDKTFGPEEPVTREQMALMLKRALVLRNKAQELNTLYVELTLGGFADRNAISSWARDGVAIAVEKGIVKGRTASEFAPSATATRAEAAVMILRTYSQL